MSILILNRVPHDLCPYEDWLKELGEDLLLLSSDEYSDGFPKEQYAYFESFPNYAQNGCVELRAIELYEKYSYHTIIAVAERDIYRASQLREKLGLKGQTFRSACQYRNKVMMKEIARKAGILTPEFLELKSNFHLVEFSRKHPFPIVVKPIDSAGSMGTIVLEKKSDLKRLLTKGIPPYSQAETFVEGEMYHIDGLVYHGEVVFITVSKYSSSCLAFHEGGFTGSYLIDQKSKLAKRLVQETEKLISVLDTPLHTTFHAEFFHTPTDEIVLCEIASRTGGGRVNIILEKAFGFNITKSMIYAQLGLPIKLPNFKKGVNPAIFTGHALLPPRRGEFVSIETTSMPDWVIEFRLLAKPGKVYDAPKSSVDHICSVVVKGDHENEVLERMNQIADWFHSATKWR